MSTPATESAQWPQSECLRGRYNIIALCSSSCSSFDSISGGFSDVSVTVACQPASLSVCQPSRCPAAPPKRHAARQREASGLAILSARPDGSPDGSPDGPPPAAALPANQALLTVRRWVLQQARNASHDKSGGRNVTLVSGRAAPRGGQLLSAATDRCLWRGGAARCGAGLSEVTHSHIAPRHPP